MKWQGYCASPRSDALDQMLGQASASDLAPAAPAAGLPSDLVQRLLSSRQSSQPVTLAAASEKKQIELYSPAFYGVAALGGVISCGTTHTAMTPLDVVKCNMQIDHKKYKNITTGFQITLKEGGVSNLIRGWAPTFVGYSIQGAGKFGLYEVFKKKYRDAVGEQTFKNNKTLVYLAASASAETIADFGLCPWEAVKVKVQTSPGWAKGLSDGFPKFVAENGWGGLYKGLTPLIARQVPYTMTKFSLFEAIIDVLYEKVVTKPRSECSKVEQLEVSFAAGYMAGIGCAVISQPADNMVSMLNGVKGATIGSVIKDMGWTALFLRGLPLRIVMIGTLTGAQWGIYDAVKVSFGLPAT